jgi:hypothetical protein
MMGLFAAVHESGNGTEETINWAAAMAAYWGKAVVPLGSQMVSR